MVQNNRNTNHIPKKATNDAFYRRILLLVFPILVIIIAALLPVILHLNNKPEKDTEQNAYLPQEETTAADESENSNDVPEPAGSSYFAAPTQGTATIYKTIESEYGILINLKDNTVVATKNATAKMYPASMTKMMTLIVAYENAHSMDDTFVMTREIIDPLYEENASVAGFEIGEEIKVRDLFYGAAMPSGADATTALAIYVAESEVNFVALMNKKAEELGLKNTHFANASGLHDDNHYSTVEDMAVIFKYALSIPECRKMLTTKIYTTSPTNKHPNGLTFMSTVFKYLDGKEVQKGVTVIGGKTGYTEEARNCLASIAVNSNGVECIFVSGLAPSRASMISDCIYMHTKYSANQ